MLTNFTAQDILGTSLAFFLFPLLFISPGFVIAWLLNLLEIKQRSLIMQLGIALIISISVSPILVFLCWRLVSFAFTLGVLLVFFAVFCFLLLKNALPRRNNPISKDSIPALILAIGWIFLALFSLIDLQFGNRLYYSIVSLDYTARTAVIDAISRTGVPPINPSYYPGQPVKLTSLYYFWYVMVSVIDKAGLDLVNGRQALIASAIWSGLALMALISIYLRLRSPQQYNRPWRLAIIGISSLAIGGLDIVPGLILLFASRFALGKFFYDGVIEHWNEQIATWLTSILWDPHHVASLIACITGLLLIHFVADRPRHEQIVVALVAGLGFASAFGLSVWTTLVFCAFLGVWFVYQLFFEKKPGLAMLLVLAGVVALVAAAPFIIDLLKGLGTSASDGPGGSPLILSVRKFNLALPLTLSLPALWQNLIFFALLPLNYSLELGYFFIIAFLWLKQTGKRVFRAHPYQTAEIFLLGVTFLLASFVKSTIGNNDFGWRAWLFGQFVLLIWSTDFIITIYDYSDLRFPIESQNRKSKIAKSQIATVFNRLARKQPLLALFLLVGLLTTFANALSLRTWPTVIDANLTMPYELSQDAHLGERSFAARQAYQFIGDHLPLYVIIEPNPTVKFDRPLGLYGNRQIAISHVAAYGVSAPEIERLQKPVEPIFLSKTALSWETIDSICGRYHIDVVIASDLDPLWQHLGILKQVRSPLYQNDYYAIFKCGNK